MFIFIRQIEQKKTSGMIRPKFAFEEQQKQVIKPYPESQSHLIDNQNLFEINGESSRVEFTSKQQDQQIRKKSNTNHTTLNTNNQKLSQTTEKHHLDIHPQDINSAHHQLHQNSKIDPSVTNSLLLVPEIQRPRKKSTSYEQKIDLFHKGEPSQVKPNLLLQAQNGNRSPVLQNYSNYTIKPQQTEKAYDPYDQKIRNKKMKMQSRIASSKKAFKAEQLPLQENMAEKKRMDEIFSENSSNMAFGNYQSTIVVSKPIETSLQPPHYKIHPFSEERIQESLKSILNKVQSVTQFQLLRQKKCCFNYMNPDFKLLHKNGSVAVSAKKQFCHFNSYYNITVSQMIIGCLRGNFGGTAFNLYQFKGRDEELVATITYEANFACGEDFRKIEVYIKNQNDNDLMFARETKRKNLKQLYQDGYTQNIKKLITKQPKWCDKSQCFTLNFKGKGKLPSIKNMILVPQQKVKGTSLIFCKRQPDSFYLQIDPSLSIFMTMGILMSSFDFKLFCQ